MHLKDYDKKMDMVPPPRGLSLTDVLTLIFVVLKLAGLVSWSWFWVLSPLWIQWVLVFAFATVHVTLGLILKKKVKR